MKGLLFALLIISTGIDVNAEPFETEEVKVFESVVFFDRDKSKISADGIKKLQVIKDGSIEVIGFASSEGSSEHNEDLSLARADAVADILNRPVSISALGESDAKTPVDPLDRKVIIRVTTTDIVYNPIFGGYEMVYGPVHHLQWKTIPR